jgi:hypothetical protein
MPSTDASVDDAALLSDRMRFVIPASGQELRNDMLPAIYKTAADATTGHF